MSAKEFQANYTAFESACQITSAILKTQEPLKCSPLLFNLSIDLLKQISITPEESKKILGIFYLKLMCHEGIFPLQWKCDHCQNPINEEVFSLGFENYCKLHAPSSSLVLSHEEAILFRGFALEKNKKQLLSFPFDDIISKKIHQFFHMNLERAV